MDRRTQEVQSNYQFFQTVVASLMLEHEGKYALLHDRAVVSVYSRPLDAVIEGNRLYSDGLFSVQRVTDRPVDLGFLSNAANSRITA